MGGSEGVVHVEEETVDYALEAEIRVSGWRSNVNVASVMDETFNGLMTLLAGRTTE